MPSSSAVRAELISTKPSSAQPAEDVDVVQQGGVDDHDRVRVRRPARAPGSVRRRDPAERHDRRAHPLGAEARERLRLVAVEERGRPTAARPRSPRPDRRGRGAGRGTDRAAARSRRADEPGQVDEACGVAPLVVVPAEDLDHPAGRLGQARVEHARRRVADDVGRDDRIGACSAGDRPAGRSSRRPRTRR